MIYKFLNIDSLTEEMTAKYFPLLSETKQKNIMELPSPRERALAFCCEIVARQCLHELFHAPEFSFKLLLDPNGKSAVGNFNAGICLCTLEDTIGCAASNRRVGISMMRPENYTFNDLQKSLTDAELRDVFSFSRFSYTELLKRNLLDEEKVCLRAAAYLALKQSYFKAKGKVLNMNYLSVEFEIRDESVKCSDKKAEVSAVGYDAKNNYMYAVEEYGNE